MTILRKITVIFFVFIQISILFAQDIELNNNTELEQFIQLKDVWNNCNNTKNYVDYETQLLSLLDTEPTSITYPYILAECFFYKYFTNFIELNNNSKVEESISSLIESFFSKETNDITSIAVAKYFLQIAKMDPFNRMGIGADILEQEQQIQMLVSTRINKILPDSINERITMLHSVANLETQNNELKNNNLIITKDEYIKTMSNPALSFVLSNDSNYSLLFEAYKKIEEEQESVLLGDYAQAYYNLMGVIPTAIKNQSKYGVLLQKYVSEFANSIIQIYSLDPFLITALQSDQLQNVFNEIKFASIAGDLYNSRIIKLVYKVGAENE